MNVFAGIALFLKLREKSHTNSPVRWIIRQVYGEVFTQTPLVT